MEEIFDIPSMEESEFKKIYETVKDIPEAVAELDDIMQEVIDRMTPLVERHERLSQEPSEATEDEITAIEEEKLLKKLKESPEVIWNWRWKSRAGLMPE